MPIVEAPKSGMQNGGVVVINRKFGGLPAEISTLVIPDGDGTTIDFNVIPRSVRRGVRSIKFAGGVVALFTGRSAWAVRKKERNALVTHGIYSTENGARLILGATEVHHPLTINEQNAVLTEVDANREEIAYVVSFPQDTARRPVRWVADAREVDAIVERYGSYADIVTGSLVAFEEMIRQQQPGLLLIRPRVSGSDPIAFSDEINVVLSEQGVYNIGPAGITKLTAAEELASILHVVPKEIIVAGNGPNDNHLLLKNATPVLVGSHPVAESNYGALPGIVKMPTVRDFGNFLFAFAQQMQQKQKTQ